MVMFAVDPVVVVLAVLAGVLVAVVECLWFFKRFSVSSAGVVDFIFNVLAALVLAVLGLVIGGMLAVLLGWVVLGSVVSLFGFGFLFGVVVFGVGRFVFELFAIR